MGRIIGNIEMENPLDLKDWFCHLCYVFNLLKASHMFIAPGSDEIDVGAIQNTFPKFETLHIERVSPRQSKNVLEAFYQDVEVLKINSNPFGKNDPLYRKILIQNYDNLHLGCLPPREKFELNDLLMCNSISINYHTTQNFKGINQFLKLWMKGCNPRLRELCISQRNLNPEDVLKGVRGSKNIPEEEDIIHNNEVLPRGYHDVLPSVAIEIWRFDGTKAAVCMIGGTFWLLVENN
ncbi:hypothetical protein CAEBREN_00420 [Caenorhabditis brenneri]|uniref:Sdz-33 F-box domain-containing protein n=1 Tax=Caenorhabditis brenneri TaxID=135651 RepID=G0NZM3_CAEBE|nr:hypothetical protein CAEBREN_00420 [Caenorhabditis brenneri]